MFQTLKQTNLLHHWVSCKIWKKNFPATRKIEKLQQQLQQQKNTSYTNNERRIDNKTMALKANENENDPDISFDK